MMELKTDLKMSIIIPMYNAEKYIGICLDSLNSTVFFLVRKFYMLRCLFGALYVDMSCFGVSWVFSKHEIPTSMDKSQKCHFNI